MLNLRFPWLWIGVGCLLVASVCIGSLLPARHVSGALNDKFVHFASYFLLTVWFSGLYSRTVFYALIAIVVIALGAVLDVLQGVTATRHFDLLDVLANSVGAMVGFALSWSVLGGWCDKLERWIVR